jgi:hypothetical protein
MLSWRISGGKTQMERNSTLADAIDDRIAAQWIALGAQLEGIDDRTAIDLDALAAATAAQGSIDARVRGVAIDWCVRYGTAINTSRLRRIAREAKTDDTALARFGGEVASAGGPHWSFADESALAPSRGKVVARDLLAPARISWRIRSGFGVTARSDILTALLTTPSKPISVADLARRARHSKRNTAAAVAGMSLAGIVRTSRVGNQDRVWLDVASPLRTFLEPGDVPDIDWASRWAVVQRAARVDIGTRTAPETVRLVETRVVAEALLPFLEPGALPYPSLTASGSAWGNAFEAWLADLATGMSLMSA